MAAVRLHMFGVLPDGSDGFSEHLFEIEDDRVTAWHLVRNACVALGAGGPSGEVVVGRLVDAIDPEDPVLVEPVSMHVPLASLDPDDGSVFVAWVDTIDPLRLHTDALGELVLPRVPKAVTLDGIAAAVSDDVALVPVLLLRGGTRFAPHEYAAIDATPRALGDLRDLSGCTLRFVPADSAEVVQRGESGGFAPVEASGAQPVVVDEDLDDTRDEMSSPEPEDDASVERGEDDAPDDDDHDPTTDEELVTWLRASDPMPKVNATVLLHLMDNERIGKIEVDVDGDRLVVKSRHKEDDVYHRLEEFRRQNQGRPAEDFEVKRSRKRWF